MLEREGGKEPKGYPKGHTATEGEEKDVNTVEDRAYVDFQAAELGEGLVHNEADRVI